MELRIHVFIVKTKGGPKKLERGKSERLLSTKINYHTVNKINDHKIFAKHVCKESGGIHWKVSLLYSTNSIILEDCKGQFQKVKFRV